MVDPLNPDDAQDATGAKKNFVGRVEFSRVDCNCEQVCGRAETQYESDIDHFMHIVPLDGTYDKPQNVLALNWPSKGSRRSIWYTVMAHLTDVHGPIRDEIGDVDGEELFEAMCEFVEGRVYEFRDITWEEEEEVPHLGITYDEVDAQRTLLVPVREVTDPDELADLGEDADAGVDDTVTIE